MRAHALPAAPVGSKDSTLLLWDMRVAHSVAQLGLPQPDGSRKAHAQMITCLDASGHLLFSGGTDKTVKLWDLRCLLFLFFLLGS